MQMLEATFQRMLHEGKSPWVTNQHSGVSRQTRQPVSDKLCKVWVVKHISHQNNVKVSGPLRQCRLWHQVVVGVWFHRDTVFLHIHLNGNFCDWNNQMESVIQI